MEEEKKNAELADQLMGELKLQLDGYKAEEIRSELVQCLPDILKLDVTLLQNEIVNLQKHLKKIAIEKYW